MLRAGPSRSAPPADLSLVVFALGPVHYALSVSCIRQVLQPLEVSPLPEASKGVLGLSEVRGEVILVLDLRPAPSARPKWLLVQSPERLVGLVVDKVLGVMRFALAELQPPPASERQASAFAGVQGLVRQDKELILVLHPSYFDRQLERLHRGALGTEALRLLGQETPEPPLVQ